jgi:hypothetical protein
MNKAYTYADFITESMNYQHSQEYYGFMKEMAEIELMSSYLASQQFLAEEASEYSFVEGYLVEAGDTEPVKNKIAEKAKNLIKKIIEALKKAWNVFVKFVTSIPEKVKGLISKIKGTKAADSLQFVADKAKSDPTNTEKVFNQVVTGKVESANVSTDNESDKTDSEPVNTDILNKRFREIIDIPDIYNIWQIGATDLPSFPKDKFFDFDSIHNPKTFEIFTKVSKILADFINNEGNGEIDVIFFMKPDRNKLDKPVYISYSAFSFIVKYITKWTTEMEDMDKVLDKVKEVFIKHDRAYDNSVVVTFSTSVAVADSIDKLQDEFTQKMDSLLASLDESVDPKDIKCLNEINSIFTWAISEYMTAANHAFKLVTDIVKVSGKIKAAYEKREKENQSATS